MKTKDYSELFKVELDVDYNIYHVEFFNLDQNTFESLDQYLQENNITKISLHSNKLENKGIEFLAALLKTNNTLTSIDLDNNNIRIEGFKFLTEALKENKTLISISLRFNKIWEEEIKFLVEALKINNTLTSINLDHNHIFNHGARFLAKALKINSTLTSINLKGNEIDIQLTELIEERLKENKVICQGIDDNCEIISKFNNFDQFKTINIKANKLLIKKITDTLMSISSEDLQKFYQENNIDDQSFNSYQQFLEKKTKEGEAIKQAFQQYHNITDDFVSFLKITGFTKQHCGNLDFYQQIKFYENLAHCPIKVIFACFQNYTLEEVMNDPLLIPALHKICQQLDKHQGNSAFMELVAEIPLFNSIINSEIVFESLKQNEILLSNIDIEMQLKGDKNEKDEKEKIKEKDRLELEEKQFISKEVERIDWDHTYQKMKNKNNNTNEKEVDYGYLFEDSSEENDHQVNKIGEIHENFDN